MFVRARAFDRTKKVIVAASLRYCCQLLDIEKFAYAAQSVLGTCSAKEISFRLHY